LFSRQPSVIAASLLRSATLVYHFGLLKEGGEILMSWKSIVTTGLLCLIAAPVWALPSIRVDDGGLSGGNRVWNVIVTPSLNSAMGVELGFARTTGAGNILTAVSNSNWEDDGVAPIGNPGSNPYTLTTTEGVQPVGGGGANVFASLGSTNIITSGTGTTVLTITTAGNISVLDLTGAVGPSSDSAVVWDDSGPLYLRQRYGIYGDFAGGGPNNNVGNADFGEFASLFGKPVISQSPAEMAIIDRFLKPGGGVVGNAEFGKFASNFGFSGTAPPPGPGGGGLTVPEPTAVVLLLFGTLAGLLTRKRR
jgi:hypothetical protein